MLLSHKQLRFLQSALEPQVQASSTVILSSPPGAIQVQLTDVPLENQDFGSVGAQTWGGACVLAEGHRGGSGCFWTARVGRKRVLELGAGTGLVSITVGKLLEGNVTVVATDFLSVGLGQPQNPIARIIRSACIGRY